MNLLSGRTNIRQQGPTSRRLLAALLFVAVLAAAAYGIPVIITDARGEAVTVTDASRIVTLGSGITETVVALGAAARIVGVDSSSAYPANALEGKPRTNSVRSLSAESVLSLSPTMVVGSVDAGPPEVLAQIESAGVPVVIVPQDDSLTGVVNRVRFIARAIGAERAAESLVRQIERQYAQAQQITTSTRSGDPPTVMFVYSRGAGTIMVSGTETSADAMIALAGGINAIKGYTGYRPLTAEAVLAANPDVILMPASGLASLGGVEGLEGVPGIAQTTAFQSGRVLAYDGTYLLGFGPRTGAAIHELASDLYNPAP